jgi:hypothetical protein
MPTIPLCGALSSELDRCTETLSRLSHSAFESPNDTRESDFHIIERVNCIIKGLIERLPNLINNSRSGSFTETQGIKCTHETLEEEFPKWIRTGKSLLSYKWQVKRALTALLKGTRPSTQPRSPKTATNRHQSTDGHYTGVVGSKRAIEMLHISKTANKRQKFEARPRQPGPKYRVKRDQIQRDVENCLNGANSYVLGQFAHLGSALRALETYRYSRTQLREEQTRLARKRQRRQPDTLEY